MDGPFKKPFKIALFIAQHLIKQEQKLKFLGSLAQTKKHLSTGLSHNATIIFV